MNPEYKNLIVKKSDEIEIGQFNDSKDYIITNKQIDNRIIVNQKTLDILNLVDGKTKLEDIVSKFNQVNLSSNIDIGTAYKLLYEKLGKQGVIINDNIVLQKKEIASYLSLSFTLLNKKAVNFLTKIVSPFIWFKYFYVIFFSSLAIVIYTIVANISILKNSILQLPFAHWVIYLLVTGVILFLHELGHAAACKKLGAEPGSIGFGFYLLSPVMFADVSDIWKLKSKERNYVNLSGLYMELLVALILTLVYFFIIQSSAILIINSVILLSIIVNLNPFLRYDGYWILSDSLNIPNLRTVSIQKLNSLIQAVLNKKKFKSTKREVFLIIYAIISVISIFLFLIFVLVRDPNSLLSFPVDLYNYVKEYINGNRPFSISDYSPFILPFLFYFIIGKYLFGYFRNFFKFQL